MLEASMLTQDRFQTPAAPTQILISFKSAIRGGGFFWGIFSDILARQKCQSHTGVPELLLFLISTLHTQSLFRPVHENR